ncbi:putative ABC transporter ATP-binding protein [Candidatus Gugararchaeum adminiculabundum]|nr:putative ABC transporter ATP-binding protein [Candidatus Gugararchaeum adminiculabundum]
MAVAKTILKMAGVTKEYKNEGKFQALKDASFEVKKGEFVAIVGPSGSGKSTLLHLLGCLDKPTRGEIYIDGEPVSEMGSDSLAEIRREKIGFVFQAFNLASTLDASKNVELPLIISGRDADERAVAVENLLALVGIAEKAHNMPNELSGGERQRVAVARALTNNPSIILADEPTGNLDSKSGKDVMELFSRLWGQGITIILITHEPQVAAYAGRVISLKDGRIESDVLQKPKKSEEKELKLKGF